MADIQEIMMAFHGLNEGMQQYAIGSGIREAQDQVAQLQQQQLGELEKRAAQTQISNTLALRLSQVGTPVSQIQQAAGVLAPAPLSNAEAAYAQGVAKQSPELIDLAKKMQDFEQNPKRIEEQAALLKQSESAKQGMEKQAAELKSKESEGAAGRRNQLEIAKLLNQTKVDVQELKGSQTGTGKPLAPKEIETLQSFDDSAIRGSDLLQSVQQDSNLVGPIVGNNPLRRFSADTASFDASVGRWFDAYRRQITGAQASDKEIKLLEKRTPLVTDPPAVFQQKVNDILKIGEAVKNRYITNLGKGGRNVSQYLNSSTEAAGSKYQSAMEWAKANPTNPKSVQIIQRLKQLGQ